MYTFLRWHQNSWKTLCTNETAPVKRLELQRCAKIAAFSKKRTQSEHYAAEASGTLVKAYQQGCGHT